MKEKITTGVIGGLISAFTYLWGGFDHMMASLLLFMVVDYITGLLASGVEGKVSSKVGYKGIAKKLGMLLVIVICYRLDQMGVADMLNGISGVDLNSPARGLALILYIGNEGISILENLDRMKVPIPGFLRKAFESMRSKEDNGKDDENGTN